MRTKISTYVSPSFFIPTDELYLHRLSLEELAHTCGLMSEKLGATNISSNHMYILEIWRRISRTRDQAAWELFVCCLSPHMLYLMQLHPGYEIATKIGSEEDYVFRAFSRFWQTWVDQNKLECDDLAILLKFLSLSLNAVIIDTLRNAHQSKYRHSGADLYNDRPAMKTWLQIRQLLTEGRERRVAFLLFQHGLTPEQILVNYPDEFQSLQEILRIRNRIIQQVGASSITAQYE